jgi:hypothetical protein
VSPFCVLDIFVFAVLFDPFIFYIMRRPRRPHGISVFFISLATEKMAIEFDIAQ